MEHFRRNQTNPKPWTVTIFASREDAVDWKQVQRVYADDQIGAYTIAMMNVCDKIPMTAKDDLSVVCEPGNKPEEARYEQAH